MRGGIKLQSQSMKYLLLITILFFETHYAGAQVFKEIKKFQIPAAKQGVAVDEHHFYVINNSQITKHSKKDGQLIVTMDGKPLGYTHLNSGVVLEGKLYCANSNFPGIPMLSSVEIFDANTLTHIGSHSFGLDQRGSLTWIDRKDGYWWAVFAQYSGKNASEGKDNRWTTLVKLDDQWQQHGAWVFPEKLSVIFGNHSSSGGNWSREGTIYCTGHDNGEIYELSIPKAGYILEYIRTIPTEAIQGQGIALDRSETNKTVLYGIQRTTNRVTVSELQ